MRVITVALISAIVSAPLSLSVLYIISNVLSKETRRNEDRVVSPVPMARRNTRQVAMCQTKSIKERCGSNVLEDKENLVREILLYRKGISAKERQIFDGKSL